ncbi:hypothetical protein ACOMICROBIO_EPCKBFOG_02257 [Vibrio sp. B1FLJ16]|nr:hypothetical protein ACOMICROBIO_EPCKBFOG_02257 [Vibrio sp. B1FLJ16]CAE6914914.1 hypothetical protein ACOMICROBIO_EPCKBFOG_02257 [Vibrio sp. B1FLJ16]
METLSSLTQNWFVAENIMLLMVLVSTICVVSAIFFCYYWKSALAAKTVGYFTRSRGTERKKI